VLLKEPVLDFLAKTFVGSEGESGGAIEWLAIFTRKTHGKQLITDATGTASLQAVPRPVVFVQYLKQLAHQSESGTQRGLCCLTLKNKWPH
jgi:hypothetical protein